MSSPNPAPPNLFDKVWEAHSVRTLPGGQTQLLIGLHLIHEVTSPQAFAMLRERGLKVAYPERTVATIDHIIPTDTQLRPLQDGLAEEMMKAIETNTRDFGVQLLTPENGDQGIVHVVGPERGLTQPGMTVVCGDSHTSTHGAFGTIALGIGTSQVAHVLATGTMALAKPKVRKVSVDGELGPGVSAKDVALAIIRHLGVQGGVGYAYEYSGDVFKNMSME
ncbi:MAG: aconitase family protein, partial [Planctomycetota bacterium]